MPALTFRPVRVAANRAILRACWLDTETAMFVRAVWRIKRLVDIKQTLREMEVPTTRDALGLSGTDFQKMTRGLFDR